MSLLSPDEVVRCFFKVLYPGISPAIEQIKDVLREAQKLNKEGWRYQDICNKIVEYDKNNATNTKPTSLYDIWYFNEQTPPLKEENNLLEEKFYYHNRLQSKPQSPRIYIDEEGNVQEDRDKYYLEIVDKFTLKDLNNYFTSTMSIEDEMIQNENYSTLEYMVNNYNIDLLLFTIDQTYNILNSKEYRLYKNISKIVQYIDEGESQYQKAKEAQKGKIVPFYRAYLEKRKVQ